MKKIAFIFALTLLFSFNVYADILNEFEKELSSCQDKYTLKKQKCTETWSMKCYNFLTDINKEMQLCYKNAAVKILTQFYNVSEKDAQNKIDTYVSFIYDEYLFLYNNTNYCKQNNCGVSPYLYSEYTTTQELYNYVYKMIKSVSAHN